MIKGGIGLPFVRAVRVVVDQRWPEILLDNDPGADIHQGCVDSIDIAGAWRYRRGDRGDHRTLVYPTPVRFIESAPKCEERFGHVTSLVRIVIRRHADQRVGAVLAHDRNVVERYGDGGGHRVGAFRDGHNSTAGQTYRIDRTLQLRRDVSSARDSHQLAAGYAAGTFHS